MIVIIACDAMKRRTGPPRTEINQVSGRETKTVLKPVRKVRVIVESQVTRDRANITIGFAQPNDLRIGAIKSAISNMISHAAIAFK